ncbi:NUDIX domain-containing protein [Paenibacillus alvei]|uniref:NUDIX domain-containing protein n=1 Tax=Paenibacillus alvei TaxID=44250 RepID=A0ABT4GU08_PAEAL|nr:MULTISPECIES: NUDIX domain-containing protein [Paenibacillus]EJW17932.1 hydrolase, NUDIX family [Paenibacillus alvei DSM 29]MCY7483354.1 NUDIX domain-containing protein [Paenibacillus alvei]MCY9543851.1 NUDIX domain-containing protein [Paenibacillus alvei]MCY9703436.1 NUDIX domain-containing protein [Paenibacillus alvei]MCY9732318.1 NUDIX domain-containing protein [Paenibacillus alvei]
MLPIRNSAKAIIIQDEKVLLTKNKDHEGFFYLFPGGGQEHGEQLSEALKRECVEEIGCNIRVYDLAFVREYIGKNHQFAEWDAHVHQVEFYFHADIAAPLEAEVSMQGTNPDEHQVGVEWVALSALDQIRVYPAQLIPKLQDGSAKNVYMGDTN